MCLESMGIRSSHKKRIEYDAARRRGQRLCADGIQLPSGVRLHSGSGQDKNWLTEPLLVAPWPASRFSTQPPGGGSVPFEAGAAQVLEAVRE